VKRSNSTAHVVGKRHELVQRTAATQPTACAVGKRHELVW